MNCPSCNNKLSILSESYTWDGEKLIPNLICDICYIGYCIWDGKLTYLADSGNSKRLKELSKKIKE